MAKPTYYVEITCQNPSCAQPGDPHPRPPLARGSDVKVPIGTFSQGVRPRWLGEAMLAPGTSVTLRCGSCDRRTTCAMREDGPRLSLMDEPQPARPGRGTSGG